MKFKLKPSEEEIELQESLHANFLVSLYERLESSRDFDAVIKVIERDARTKPVAEQRWFRRDSVAQCSDRDEMSSALSRTMVQIKDCVVKLKRSKEGDRYFFECTVQDLLIWDIYENERFSGRLFANDTQASCMMLSLASIIEAVFARIASSSEDFPSKENVDKVLDAISGSLNEIKDTVLERQAQLKQVIDLISATIIPELRDYVEVRYGNASFNEAIEKVTDRFSSVANQLLIELASVSQIRHRDAGSAVVYYREAGERLVSRAGSLGEISAATSAAITLPICVQPSLPVRMFEDAFGPRKFSRKPTKGFVLKALQENALSDYIFRDLRQEILVNRGLEGPELTNEIDRQSKAFWGGRGKHQGSQPHRKIVDEKKSIELYKLIRAIYKNLFAIRQVTRDLGVVWWTSEIDSLNKSVRQLKEAYARAKGLSAQVLLTRQLKGSEFISAFGVRWRDLIAALNSVDLPMLESATQNIRNVDISVAFHLKRFRQTCNELSVILGREVELLPDENNDENADDWVRMLTAALQDTVSTELKRQLIEQWKTVFKVQRDSLTASDYFEQYIDGSFEPERAKIIKDAIGGVLNAIRVSKGRMPDEIADSQPPMTDKAVQIPEMSTVIDDAHRPSADQSDDGCALSAATPALSIVSTQDTIPEEEEPINDELQEETPELIAARLDSLYGYVAQRLNRVTFAVPEAASGINPKGRLKFIQAAHAFQTGLSEQIQQLQRRCTSYSQRASSDDEENLASLSDEVQALEQYVHAVLVPCEAMPSASLTHLIASKDRIERANRVYIAAQPSLSKRQKAWRIGGLALALSFAALAVAGGVALCVLSGGATIPVAAGACMAAIGTGAISSLSLMTFMCNPLNSKTQRQAMRSTKNACVFAVAYERINLGRAPVREAVPMCC